MGIWLISKDSLKIRSTVLFASKQDAENYIKNSGDVYKFCVYYFKNPGEKCSKTWILRGTYVGGSAKLYSHSNVDLTP